MFQHISQVFSEFITELTLHLRTELATSYSPGTFSLATYSLAKAVYTPRGVFLHAASLGQAFAHCPIFLTAASRRSLGSVSVPMWLVILSDQLTVLALVGRYPTN